MHWTKYVPPLTQLVPFAQTTLPALGGLLQQDALNATRSANARIATVQTQLDQTLQGSVARLVPSALDTVNAVVDLLTGTIHDVLGGTPLERPALQYADCLLGNKVRSADRLLVTLQQAVQTPLPMLVIPALPLATATSLLQPALTSLVRNALGPLHRMGDEEATRVRRDRLVLSLLLVCTFVVIGGMLAAEHFLL